ncbi:MAG: hypothetical protein JWP63_5403 [Candidatus Solibacter sp.]|nr:hypothetical protein [Candidatus Solibacter sp.]
MCCGNEREVTVNCPLECEFLQEARRHQRGDLAEIPQNEIPNRDIQVTEKLLRQNEALLSFLSATILRTALETPGVIDFDIREALDSLIRTYRTLQSGVYYESMPGNPLAGRIYATVQQALAEYRKAEQQQLGMTKTRDADVLGLLVFLQHFELDRNNGRRRGRAFLDALRYFYSPEPEAEPPAASSLILP